MLLGESKAMPHGLVVMRVIKKASKSEMHLIQMTKLSYLNLNMLELHLMVVQKPPKH